MQELKKKTSLLEIQALKSEMVSHTFCQYYIGVMSYSKIREKDEMRSKKMG